MTDLERLRRLARKRSDTDTEWRAMIRALHADGQPLRTIAEAAGVSHVAVLKIVRR